MCVEHQFSVMNWTSTSRCRLSPTIPRWRRTAMTWNRRTGRGRPCWCGGCCRSPRHNESRGFGLDATLRLIITPFHRLSRVSVLERQFYIAEKSHASKIAVSGQPLVPFRMIAECEWYRHLYRQRRQVTVRTLPNEVHQKYPFPYQ